MNVVDFKPSKPEPSARLIAVLEGMLEDARSGEINALVAVAFHDKTQRGNRVCHNAYSMQGVGSAYMLLHWLQDKWEDLPDLPAKPEGT